MFDPNLRRDEQFRAGNARIFNGLSHFLFIKVRLRRVDMVSDGKRVCHAALTLLSRHLIHAIAELRHPYSVCKSHIFHKSNPPFDLRLYYTAFLFERESQKSLPHEPQVDAIRTNTILCYFAATEFNRPTNFLTSFVGVGE